MSVVAVSSRGDRSRGAGDPRGAVWSRPQGQKQHPALFGGLLGVTSTSASFWRSSCILSDLCDDAKHQSSVSPSRGSGGEGGLWVQLCGWGMAPPRSLPHPHALLLSCFPHVARKMGLTETFAPCLFPGILSRPLCPGSVQVTLNRTAKPARPRLE